MIAPKVVMEIRRLLAEGMLSQRKIAGLLGVSRGSVGAIASGRRPDYATFRQSQDDEEEPAGPPERCPTCGGMVYMPCRLCRVRQMSVENPRLALGKGTVPFPSDENWDSPPVVQHVKPLELNLRPEHRARYEEVRAWRRENRGHPFVGVQK